ncbi:sigma-70 family RNA polymerase sigma factor [uncultured Aquimarina sp.]|uniref:RNA polymerase sigma factor n=1 Tax=uncultured Aquimarina sp. TaxID=575652 RepID=UPI00262FC13E|nr:sigma-70 family RNA polymerase sigma factor [uncultured Aquimarina sp.]
MDDTYIDSVLSGNIEAFSYFIKTYKNMAYNISLSIVKDEQYAEEVTQDAFMKAFNGLKSFNRTAKFKSWFYRIVVNESFLRLRSLKKRKTFVYIEEQSDAILEEQFEEISKDHTDKIHKVLSLLDSKESLALELFYLQELSINDIIAITGWTKTNTKVILHRARKSVRQIWKTSL